MMMMTTQLEESSRIYDETTQLETDNFNLISKIPYTLVMFLLYPLYPIVSFIPSTNRLRSTNYKYAGIGEIGGY